MLDLSRVAARVVPLLVGARRPGCLGIRVVAQRRLGRPRRLAGHLSAAEILAA